MDKRPPQFDEDGFLIYNGEIPPDVRLVDQSVGTGIELFTILGVAITVGTVIKVALLAFAIYGFVTGLLNKPGGFGGGGTGLKGDEGFGFDIRNSTQPDTPLTVIYGDHKTAPHYFYAKISNLGNNNRLDMGFGIGEGPISTVSGVKVNNVAFENLTGSNDFDVHLGESFELDGRLNEIAVSTDLNDEIPKSESLIRNGVRSDANELEIGVVFPQGLFSIDTTDGVVKSDATLKIEFRAVGAPDWILASGTNFAPILDPITGANLGTTGRYRIQQKHRGALRKTITVARSLTPDQYQVRVTNLTTEQGDDFDVTDGVNLDFINEYVQVDFNVEDLAYLGMSLEATSTVQGGFPQVTAGVKGRKVRVYSTSELYSVEWSDNPAWCLLDLLTSSNYGLGAFISHGDVDIVSFLNVADYLDEVDSNGARKGQLDLVMNEVQPALDWIETILTTFGGMLITSDKKIGLKVMRAEASTQAFTEANIQKGSLKIEQLDPNESTNINRINVAFFNREKDYARDVHREEVTSEISGEADVIQRNVDLFGVTRPAVVESVARKMLNSLRSNVIAVEFQADVESVAAQVGDVVSITHTLPGWSGKKFRILQIQEEQDQVRTIRGLEHNDAVYDESSSGLLPTKETNLWNPLSTASPIEDLTLFPEHTLQPDGGLRTDLGVYWTVATGIVQFFGIDHFEVYSSVSSGTELPSGTVFNSADSLSHFHQTSSGTVISGSLFSPFAFEGSVYPPNSSFRIRDVNPLDFYNVAVISITDNFVSQDLASAVTQAVFVTTYSGQPTNTSSFSATPSADDIIFQWNEVSPQQAPNLKGYEIRDENANFGVDDSSRIFLGNATGYVFKDIAFRSSSFFIKAFNNSGIYSQTSRSAAFSNPAPGAVTQNGITVIGPTLLVSWGETPDGDVLGYRIWASTTPSFTPSDSNLVAEVTGKANTTYRYQPERQTSTTYAVWYIKLAPFDGLSNTLEDWNFSNEKSGTPTVDSIDTLLENNTFNVIRDGSFRGLGQWATISGALVAGDRGIVSGANSTLSQFLVDPDNTIQDGSTWFLAIEARKQIGTTPDADLFMRVTDSGTYDLPLVITGTGLTQDFQRYTQPITFSDPIPGSLSVEITSSVSNNAILVDRAMLAPGDPNSQFLSSAFDYLRGVNDAITETEIGENAIAARHLQADSVAAENIIANSITADRYNQLRNTLAYSFSGEVDGTHPLIVDFHIPSELTTDNGAQGIIQVLLSIQTRPFRGTSTADTEVSSSSLGGTTADNAHTTHTHTLSSAFASSVSGPTLVYTENLEFGLSDLSSSSVTVFTSTDGTPSHSHEVIIDDAGLDDAFVIIAPLPDGTKWIVNAGFSGGDNGEPPPYFLPLINTEASEGHGHTFTIPYTNDSGVFVYYKSATGTLIHGPTCTAASTSSVLSNLQANAHSHDFLVPEHQHGVAFGIFEEVTNPDIDVFRSNDGTVFEETAVYSFDHPTTSGLNIDLDASGTFFTGTGFKALQISGTDRVRISGLIEVKVDLNA